MLRISDQEASEDYLRVAPIQPGRYRYHQMKWEFYNPMRVEPRDICSSLSYCLRQTKEMSFFIAFIQAKYQRKSKHRFQMRRNVCRDEK